MKTLPRLLLLTLPLLLALSSCGHKEDPNPQPQPKPKPTPVAVSGVSLDKTSASVAVGETLQLQASVSPADASDKNVTWSTSDASVATVSNGLVKGIKEGSATIEAAAGGKKATCAIQVVKGGFPEGKLPQDNEIWYTTADNKPLDKVMNQGSCTLQSNTYKNGMGVLTFSGPIKRFHFLTDDSKISLKVTGLLLPDCVEAFEDDAFFFGYDIREFRVPASLKVTNGSLSSEMATPKLEQFTGNHVSEDGRCIIIDKSLLAFAPAGLTSYDIPAGVTTIGVQAFAYSPELKSVVIPSGVLYLEDSSFSHTGLESVTIPASVISIHSYSFVGSDHLKNLLGDNTRFISADRKFLYNPDGYLGKTLFFFAGKDDTSYEIPSGIHFIENYAFQNCRNLKSLTFPESLFQIAGEAFLGCENLESLEGKYASPDHKGYMNEEGKLMILVPQIDDDYVVPDGVKGLGDNLFSYRKSLKSVTMGDSVTSLGNYVFSYCTSLRKVVFSANLRSIGYNPFSRDEDLEEVYFRGLIPPSYNDTQFWEFRSLKMYVPAQSLQLYTTNYGWKDYWKKMKPYNYTDLPTPEYYVSSDYSKEGEVTVYQTATEGNGIDIVFMGDAYSDRQVAGGIYFEDLKACAENFFAIEPYKTYRKLFNVSFVTTVSATEGYQTGGQSLGSTPGLGTSISGNDSKCFELARKAVKEEKRMDEVLVVVCVNQDLSGEVRMAGTCFMHDPKDWGGSDYASGPSVAYFLKLDEAMKKSAQVVQHEAGGHGFVKLADEYVYSGTVPDLEKQRIKEYAPHGWYANVDLTSDPARIKWAWFLTDDRYKKEVGIYEGGSTYEYGVWRPSENSIMRYNDYGAFNAPSRYVIWYRIHKLAYGKEWKGSYEDFATYDAVNRKP